MNSKAPTTPAGTMHTAGIYADMSVDGPEIGTLVVIVDRAKNLPNRKSIGKQDPYCAARLGKEAKKTDTDFRGGQTPKWDQELRFTVHDSPDYYQLKLSVFNDDKKVDLIGETWIDLKEVILPGGGQNDVWHSLNFRGKYAGEVRIEITYYDTRPKPERSPARVRQTSSNDMATSGGRDSLGGPREQKPVMKRRPLPADPTAASPSPLATPEYIQTPPRGYHTPSGHVQTQSPLQSIEYNTPPLRTSQSQQGYGQSPASYRPLPGMIAVTPTAQPIHDDRYEIYDPSDANVYEGDNAYSPYDNSFQNDGRGSQQGYNRQDSLYELPVPNEYSEPYSPDGPPPPPPAHGSKHTSPAPSAHMNYPYSPSRAPQELPADDLRQTAFRHSMSSYGNANDPTAAPREPDFNASYPGRNHYQSPPRHHSYDDRFSSSYHSMQPTVEDAPPSPSSNLSSSYRSTDRRLSQYDDRRYEDVPVTAPLNLSGRGSSASGHYNNSSGPKQLQYQGAAAGSPSHRVPQHRASDTPLRQSYGHTDYQAQNQRRQSEDHARSSPGSGYLPPVPASLVPGMDPVIAQEISDRIYSDSRDNYSQNPGLSSRNRYPEQHQQQQHRPHPLSQQEAAPAPFVPAAASYNEQQNRLATGTYTPVVKPRPISPDHRVPRKSVSPADSRPSPEDRRLSGIPFGPDAYDALNPNVSSAASVSSSGNGTGPAIDPDAKIIMHDGREVDPSDHLPEHTWAAEPEVKTPKRPAETTRSRPIPAGAQPMPQPGRRPARDDQRPKSMGAMSSPMYAVGALSDPPSPAAPSGRNRLQKRNPHAPQVAPQSSPLGPVSPYQDNTYASRSLPRPHTMVDLSGENGYGTYSNGSPGYRGATGPPPIPAKVPLNVHRAPMAPEKIPVPVNRGPPPPPPEESAWALLEEMKNIDLGSGRARRRGQGHIVV